METPFVFGKLAVDQNFTDRREEKAFLVRNFFVPVQYRNYFATGLGQEFSCA